MHGFRDNEVLRSTGYDVIVISPLGDTLGAFFYGFSKSNHDSLLAFHSNFSSAMHGFRDNEDVRPNGYDVIVISQLGGRLRHFLLMDSKRTSMTF